MIYSKYNICSANQVVIRSNAEEFSEITEGDGGVSLKPEVTVVMCWSQITSFTVGDKTWRANQRQGYEFLFYYTYSITWRAAHCSIQRFEHA